VGRCPPPLAPSLGASVVQAAAAAGLGRRGDRGRARARCDCRGRCRRSACRCRRRCRRRGRRPRVLPTRGEPPPRVRRAVAAECTATAREDSFYFLLFTLIKTSLVFGKRSKERGTNDKALRLSICVAYPYALAVLCPVASVALLIALCSPASSLFARLILAFMGQLPWGLTTVTRSYLSLFSLYMGDQVQNDESARSGWPAARPLPAGCVVFISP